MTLVDKLQALRADSFGPRVEVPVDLFDALLMHLAWRGVPGLPHYEAHPDGKVRTYRSRGRVLREPRPLYPTLDKWGYPQLNVYDGFKWVRWRLHTIVAVTFIGPQPVGQVVRHLDDQKENCSHQNLAYGTHSQNRADAHRNGRVRYGGTKLDVTRVAQLRDHARYNRDPKYLAGQYGVSVATVRDILANRTWKEDT